MQECLVDLSIVLLLRPGVTNSAVVCYLLQAFRNAAAYGVEIQVSWSHDMLLRIAVVLWNPHLLNLERPVQLIGVM
jgi:hypothetical protein